MVHLRSLKCSRVLYKLTRIFFTLLIWDSQTEIPFFACTLFPSWLENAADWLIRPRLLFGNKGLQV